MPANSPLELDHVFITCAVQAPEADALIAHGFREGSRNTHTGQGTANRRFFFDNFMLELLWVENPVEASSAPTRRTRLWERWSGRNCGSNPFGVAYRPAAGEESLPPFPTWSYRPNYLPSGMAIEIAEGTTMEEPELFYMPFIRPDRPHTRERVDHALPIRHVCGVSFGLPRIGHLSEPSRLAQDAHLLTYFESATPVLEVQYSSESNEVTDLNPTLPLIFRGSQAYLQRDARHGKK